MNQYELNFNDYWRIIKKKKWLIIFTALMLTVFSILFTVVNRPTPIYQATSSIQIEKSTSLTGLYMESVSWNYGGDLPTRAEIIKSYSLVEKAAKNLGFLDSSLTSDEIKNNKQYFRIIENLKSRITTEQEGYTNIINITVKDHRPELARDLANTLAKTYQTENFILKNSKTINAIKALELQLHKAEQDYRQSGKDLENFRQKNRLLTLDSKSNKISAELLQTEEKIEDITSDIRQINQLIPKLKEDNEYFRYINIDLFLNSKNFSISSLQQKLNQYNNRLNEISQYYTPEHPSIKKLEQQKKLIKNNIINELTIFQKSLQQLRLITQKKLDELNLEYSAIPYQSQQIDNLKRELQTTQSIYQQLKVNYLQSLVKKSENIQEVFIIRPAFLPTSPTNSVQLSPTVFAGLIIGLIFGIILAFIAESLDTTFRTIDDIEQTLGTQVQGIIPFIDLNEVKESLLNKGETDIPISTLQSRSQLMTHFAPKSTVAESYRSLRTNINFSLLESNYKTIMITSSVASEGKTNVAMNLAISMAQTGLKTCLVETDLRKPRVSKNFGLERTPGLTDYILNREPLENCLRGMSDILMGSLGHDALSGNSIPGIEYLTILPAGKIERNPSEIIAGKKLDALIEQLKLDYDIIIFDSAPIIQATDAVVLGAKVDTSLILYYQGKISRNTLKRAMNQLQMLKSNILGVVINGMKADISADYIDYRYKYDYLYSYGETQNLDNENIIDKIKMVFIEEQNISHFSFMKRIKKVPVFLALVFVAILSIFLSIFFSDDHALSVEDHLINPVANQFEPKPPKTEQKTVVNIEPESLINTPTRVKQIQKSLNIKPLKVNPKSETNIKTVPQKPKKRKIIHSDLNSPFTIQILITDTKEIAEKKLNELKNLELNAFMTIDYSNSDKKKYIVCLDIFKTEIQTNNAINQIKFLGISKNLKILNLKYSLLLTKSDFNENNIYHFTIYNDKNNKNYYFAGAFKNLNTANIFKRTNLNFDKFKIIKR